MESMSFLRQAGAAAILVTLTLWIHCVGLGALLDWGKDHLITRINPTGALHSAALLVRFTNLMICLHLLEILLWAAFYRGLCFSSWEASFYFSATSYSTVGYGDFLLPRMWRNHGPKERVTGVLMCGLSASLLFAIVTRLVERVLQLSPKSWS